MPSPRASGTLGAHGGVRHGALVLVEFVVLDKVLLARRAERREELRRVAAESAHRDAALEQLMRALAPREPRGTKDCHRHLGLDTQR